ncbi:MAG: helix-turn-helix domain-containing protein [Hyphomicrobiaceae bacterium]
MFTPEQLRAARALLNWSQDDLATAAGVAVMMIKNYERHLSDPRLSSMIKLKTTLEEAGVEFIDATDDVGAGLRWSTPRAAASENPDRMTPS